MSTQACTRQPQPGIYDCSNKKRHRKNTKKVILPKLEQVVRINWVEAFQGHKFGGFDFNGCSLHLTFKDYENYVHNYWNNIRGFLPERVDIPYGNPHRIKINQRLYKKVIRSGGNLRVHDLEMKRLNLELEIIERL